MFYQCLINLYIDVDNYKDSINSGKTVSDAVASSLRHSNILQRTIAASYDTTASNTGRFNGIRYFFRILILIFVNILRRN